MTDSANTDPLLKWGDRHKNSFYWIAVGFGSGLLPKAPGTWGSLAAVILAYPVLFMPNASILLLGMAFMAFALGICAANIWEQNTGSHDDGRIVIDEFAGQWIALIPVANLAVMDMLPLGLLLSFALFRFFDVVKPQPIKYLDKNIHGGIGVMIDDVVAGVFAAAILSVLLVLLR